MVERVQGLSETYAFLGGIPAAAQHELADEIGRISRDVLAAQKADVAKDKGELQAGLSYQLITEELRARVGLLLGGRGAYSFNGRKRKGIAGGPYHGRFVEHGRRAQTVLVTRRLKRKVTGNGRTSKRRVIYEGKPYKMKVKAMAPRPFVHKDRPEIGAEQRLSNFWAGVLGRTGG
jgi:hypothetical protein